MGEKGKKLYKYLEEYKLNQIRDCMSASVRSMVGLGFPPKILFAKC